MLSGSSPITITLPSSKACQKSGPFAPPALPGFDARTTLSDSRRRPPPEVTLRHLPHLRRVSLVARNTMRTCRAHYPGGSKRVHVSIASPFHAAFPKLWAGRHPHCPFRGLLRLHSRYGPRACSTALGGLCHGASTGPDARPRRPLATSSIDKSLGGTLLHKCFAPSRRTRDSGRRTPTVIYVITIETTFQLVL